MKLVFLFFYADNVCLIESNEQDLQTFLKILLGVHESIWREN